MIGVAEIVLVVVVGLLCLLAAPFAARTWIGRLRSNAESEVLAGGRVRIIDASANLAGVTSRGVTQLRGNGCLAAYEDELVFVQWMPRRTFRVPRSEIVAVRRVDSHLGKRRFTPMLEVQWDGEGGADSAAWWVADLPAWERELRVR